MLVPSMTTVRNEETHETLEVSRIHKGFIFFIEDMTRGDSGESMDMTIPDSFARDIANWILKELGDDRR